MLSRPTFGWCAMVPVLSLIYLSIINSIIAKHLPEGLDRGKSSYWTDPLPAWAIITLGISVSVLLMSASLSLKWCIRQQKLDKTSSVMPVDHTSSDTTTTITTIESQSIAKQNELATDKKLSCCCCCTLSICYQSARREKFTKTDKEKELDWFRPISNPPPITSSMSVGKCENPPRHMVLTLSMPEMHIRPVHIQHSNHKLSTISASLSDVSLGGGCGGGSMIAASSAGSPGIFCGAEKRMSGCGSADALPTATSSISRSPASTKNKSLIEIRRGIQAALMLELVPSQPAWGTAAISLQRGVDQSLSGPLLLGEAANYSTFQCRVGDCHTSLGYNPPHSASPRSFDLSILSPISRTPEQIFPRPRSGIVPMTEADRNALRTASLPLTGKLLEARLLNDPTSLGQEFWEIPLNHASKNDCCLMGVMQKNRYPSILPHNQTRVVLPQINNDNMTSYINANYIHGYQGIPRAFIATQGPMSHTVNDFWRMIWSTRAPVVVMLTNVVELDKPKCELYLPNSSFDVDNNGELNVILDTSNDLKCELYLPNSKYDTSGGASSLNSPVRADTVPDSASVIRQRSLFHSEPIHLLQSAISLPASSSSQSSQLLPCGDGCGTSLEGSSTTETHEWSEYDGIGRTCAPVGAQKTYCSINVRVISVTHRKCYTKRILLLRCGNETRHIAHFWYLAWSDHAPPKEAGIEAARHLLQLVEETEACRLQFSVPYPKMASTCTASSISPCSSPDPVSSRVEKRPIEQRKNFARRQQAEEQSNDDFDVFLSSSLSADQPPSPPDSASSKWKVAEPKFLRGCRGSDPLPFSSKLTAADQSANQNNSDAGPVVVHCSAGIGRTGCFIGLCIGVQQLRSENRVDVLGIVSRLRLDRGGMVENELQYAFLHVALSIFNSTRNGLEPPHFPSDLFTEFPRLGR